MLLDKSQGELFEQIADLCTTVHIAIDPRELLAISLRKTMSLFGAKRGSIFILKDNGKDLKLQIAEGMAVSEQKEMVKRIGQGIVGTVAELKKPVFVDDISHSELFKNYKARTSYKTPSFLCAPLMIKDKLIGVINITDKVSGGKFRKDELQLLDFLSSQIALNYRRIQLYQKFKHIVRESKELKDELGKSSKEASVLKKQIVVHEKLATIGKLAGGIAHEFNNPLDGVMRYTNLSLEHIQNSDEVLRGYLLEVKHGLDRMANIVRSLLACSRSGIPTADRIDINQSIEQAISALKSEIYQKGVTVERDLGKDIPLVIDLGLERVVTNLVNNAIDAVGPGGVIQVTSSSLADSVSITVADNGSGIQEKEVEKIFEPFYTTKDIESGCGLGLTIVTEIVKNYKGQIDVESSPDEGTSFIVKIPVRNSDDE